MKLTSQAIVRLWSALYSVMAVCAGWFSWQNYTVVARVRSGVVKSYVNAEIEVGWNLQCLWWLCLVAISMTAGVLSVLPIPSIQRNFVIVGLWAAVIFSIIELR